MRQKNILLHKNAPLFCNFLVENDMVLVKGARAFAFKAKCFKAVVRASGVLCQNDNY